MFTKQRPAPPSSSQSADEWINGAAVGAGKSAATTQAVPEGGRTDLDPNAPANRSMSLRLNDYELERLRAAAKKTHRSVQQLIKAAVAEKLDGIDSLR